MFRKSISLVITQMVFASFGILVFVGDVEASGCSMPSSNCVIDLDAEGGRSVIYNDTMTYLSWWSGNCVSRLEVKDGGKWVNVASARVKKNAPRCKNSSPKYPNLHTHVWQVDVLPPVGQPLQMRVRSGSFADNWLTPVYRSKDEVWGRIGELFDIMDKKIKDLGK